MDAMGLYSVGSWLSVACPGQLALNESSEHVVVVEGLDIDLFDEIWASRPWGRRRRDFEASWPLVGAGALLAVVLEVDLVPLADFDLLEALDLLEVFDLLAALAAGLGALVPLVTAAIGASGCSGVCYM